MKLIKGLLTAILVFGFSSFAQSMPRFTRVFIIVFENEKESSALNVAAFARFAKMGALMNKFNAESHPSQPNYIAMTSGSTHGVFSDGEKNLNVKNIADLLENQNLSWRVYAEDYPENCFLKMEQGNFARRHVPFLSYTDITSNPTRCKNIVSFTNLFKDWQRDHVAKYNYIVPNVQNDGHNTSAQFAGDWFEKTFAPYLNNPALMKDSLFIVTFDEGTLFNNQIYTVLYGPSVVAGSVTNNKLNHYSLLKLIEDEWSLGNLGLEDAEASPIKGIWKSDL